MVHERKDGGGEAAGLSFRLTARQLVELEQERFAIAYRIENYLLDLGEGLAEWRHCLQRSQVAWSMDRLLRDGEA